MSEPMACLRALLAAAIAPAAAGLTGMLMEASSTFESTANQSDEGGGILDNTANQSDEGGHALTLCNAYAHTKSLSVHLPAKRMLLAHGPLHYKECRRVSIPLRDGERLEFRSGGLPVGSFRAVGVPQSGRLLLVPRLRGDGSRAADFLSHAFADVPFAAQVAVLDAYVGSENGTLFITDHVQHKGGAGVQRRGERLPLNAVTALGSGRYDVSLEGPDGQIVSTVTLNLAAEASYVVMRVGGGHRHLPQELVVFPDPAQAQVPATAGMLIDARGGRVAAPSGARRSNPAAWGVALAAALAAGAAA